LPGLRDWSAFDPVPALSLGGIESFVGAAQQSLAVD
jgi:hypothetical protein